MSSMTVSGVIIWFSAVICLLALTCTLLNKAHLASFSHVTPSLLANVHSAFITAVIQLIVYLSLPVLQTNML